MQTKKTNINESLPDGRNLVCHLSHRVWFVANIPEGNLVFPLQVLVTFPLHTLDLDGAPPEKTTHVHEYVGSVDVVG